MSLDPKSKRLLTTTSAIVAIMLIARKVFARTPPRPLVSDGALRFVSPADLPSYLTNPTAARISREDAHAANMKLLNTLIARDQFFGPLKSPGDKAEWAYAVAREDQALRPNSGGFIKEVVDTAMKMPASDEYVRHAAAVQKLLGFNRSTGEVTRTPTDAEEREVRKIAKLWQSRNPDAASYIAILLRDADALAQT